MQSFKYFTEGNTEIKAPNEIDDQKITLEFPEPNVPIYDGLYKRENAVFRQYDPLHVELKLHCAQSDQFFVYCHPTKDSSIRPYFNVYLCRGNREYIPECTSLGVYKPTIQGDLLKIHFSPYLPNKYAHEVSDYCLAISMEYVIPFIPILSISILGIPAAVISTCFIRSRLR